MPATIRRFCSTEAGNQFIERGGQPLGMFQDTRYHEYYHTIEPGEMLVLYTDGVTEAQNPKGEEFGQRPAG